MKKISSRVENLIQNMSLEHKIGQLNQICFSKKNFSMLKELAQKGMIGSLILASSATAGNTENEKGDLELLNELQRVSLEATGIPIINGRDVIHGHEIVLPIPLAFSASFDMDLIKEGYKKIAEEAVNDGIHWSFAPMLDISRDPRWGRCIEGPGEDPYLGASMAKAVVEGFQGENPTERNSIAACAKHFIGYGAAEGGRDYNHTEICENSLRNYYLPAFKSAVEAGVATVMSAFNDIGGIPMSSNKYLLTGVLKDELGFEGFVIGDWGAVQMLTGFGTAEDKRACSAQAFDAGIDMDMVDECYINHMSDLIKEGIISEERLNDAVARILTVKEKFGLFDNPYVHKEEIDYEEHKAFAVKAAENSMILLKNENVLPLSKKEKIALVGPMAKVRRELLGSWTLDFDLRHVESIQESMLEYNPEILIPNGELEADIRLCMKGSEVVVVVIGESHTVTGERKSIACPKVSDEQVALIRKAKAMGKKVIAVACYGRPIILTEIEAMCDAILYAWHCGTGTAQAITKILFGDFNPCGRLPMTLPRANGQLPLYYNPVKNGNNRDSYYAARYECYEDELKTPLYPFGYGLSYSQYEYSAMEIIPVTVEELQQGRSVKVSVDVKNVSDTDGYEIVQCYIRDKIASVVRPVRELKGFKKIFLEAGKKNRVTFELSIDELGYYDAKNQFIVDKGAFEVFVGDSCFTTYKQEFFLEG